jgi:hypothetical protein
VTLDQRARGAATKVRERLDKVEVPPAAPTVQRVQRHRRRSRVALVSIVTVLIAGLVFATRPTTPTQVHTTNPRPDASRGDPAGTIYAASWKSVPKESAGLGATTSISVLATAGDTLFAAGSDSITLNGPAKLWRSEDTVHWNEPAHPSQLGSVNAIAGVDLDLLAIGSTASGPDQRSFVWSSSDRGRTWTQVALDANAFGEPAPEMGRPFVDGLHWNDATHEWIASGGASDGYAGIWTSSDGAHWTSRLAPGNSAGGVTIVDDGQGGWLAYWSTLAWSSPDGHTWTPFDLHLPAGYYLQSATHDTAIAARVDGTHVTPTPLLRSADGGHNWTEDTTFLDQFPDAVGVTISDGADATIIAGFSGDPNHTDMWVSTEPSTWHALPAAFKAQPGGMLSLTATYNMTTVVMGSAPELDRYFTVDTHSWGIAPWPKECPGSIPRRLIDADPPTSADGLPPLESVITDRQHAVNVLAETDAELHSMYPRLRTLEVGPGFGRAWTGDVTPASTTNVTIVDVDDYAIQVVFTDPADCPQGAALYASLQGVPLFFVLGPG